MYSTITCTAAKNGSFVSYIKTVWKPSVSNLAGHDSKKVFCKQCWCQLLLPWITKMHLWRHDYGTKIFCFASRQQNKPCKCSCRCFMSVFFFHKNNKKLHCCTIVTKYSHEFQSFPLAAFNKYRAALVSDTACRFTWDTDQGSNVTFHNTPYCCWICKVCIARDYV